MPDPSDFDFDDVFSDDYTHFYGPLLGDERSDAEAELIAGLLELAPGMRVLDAACGYGRIARRLAARGCDVVGVDRSPTFLEMARKAGGGVDYRQADMREFAADGQFDRVVSWFTSFGYFDDDANQALLASWRRALRPGGKLLIDHQNRDRFLRAVAITPDGRPSSVVERGDDLLIDRTLFDVPTGRTHTDRISVRDGRVRRYRFSVRTFTFAELRTWLLVAGFSRVEGFGRAGEPLTLDSARMIVVASV